MSRVAVVALALTAMAGPAVAASTTFFDGTFNPANYTEIPVPPFTSSASISMTSGQCASCGNPGAGEQFVATSTAATLAETAQTILNTTFVYNPLTGGPITSLVASVDKNLGTNMIATGFGNTFRPTVEQDGVLYLAAIPGPPLTSGPSGGFTGYNTLSASLAAADFLSYDPNTAVFGTAHPNFAGDPLEFGLTQIFSLNLQGQQATADYDNLSFVVNAPEPGSLPLLAMGLAGLGMVVRRRRI